MTSSPKSIIGHFYRNCVVWDEFSQFSQRDLKPAPSSGVPCLAAPGPSEEKRPPRCIPAHSSLLLTFRCHSTPASTCPHCHGAVQQLDGVGKPAAARTCY